MTRMYLMYLTYHLKLPTTARPRHNVPLGAGSSMSVFLVTPTGAWTKARITAAGIKQAISNFDRMM